jgi:hypothetical protein
MAPVLRIISSSSADASGRHARSSSKDIVNEGSAVPADFEIWLRTRYGNAPGFTCEKKQGLLTRAFLTAANGATDISTVGTRQIRAFRRNPAPGIHSGTYFTAKA